MESAHWAREWPRCQLLLELASQYTVSGRSQGCDKLIARLESWRTRMRDAPVAVHSLLSELSYVAWLLRDQQLKAARHHIGEATRKAAQIEVLIHRMQCTDARDRGAHLRRRSAELQDAVHELLERSALLLSRCRAARGLFLGPAARRRSVPQGRAQLAG
jgi:hypothetical protein